jgi:hypothetical protein
MESKTSFHFSSKKSTIYCSANWATTCCIKSNGYTLDSYCAKILINLVLIVVEFSAISAEISGLKAAFLEI